MIDLYFLYIIGEVFLFMPFSTKCHIEGPPYNECGQHMYVYGIYVGAQLRSQHILRLAIAQLGILNDINIDQIN